MSPQLAQLSEAHPQRDRLGDDIEGLIGRDPVKRLHIAKNVAIAETKPEGTEDHEVLTLDGVRCYHTLRDLTVLCGLTALYKVWEAVMERLSTTQTILVHNSEFA